MTQDELLSKIKTQLTLCAGFDGDQTSKDRERALDAYFQRQPKDQPAPPAGRSKVVSGDVSSMTEANLASMLEAFSGERIAEFDPLGPEDEDQAQLESDAVQYFVMSKCNGYLENGQAIKDALLLRNGIVKVWVEERRKSIHKTFRNVLPEALAELTNIPGAEVKVNKYDPDTRDLSMRITRVRKKFRCEALPPDNFLYTADWDSLDLQQIPFCAERHIDRRSDLLELGFPKSKVERLTKHGSKFKSDSAARNPRGITSLQQGMDASTDPIEWYECYVLVDVDDDGIAERRRVCISGSELLSDDPVNLVPYAAGSAFINPHRFQGISVYDKVKGTWEINTGLIRALLDNVNTTTKNRIAYLDGKVNVDDVSDGRSNGALRVKSNVADVRAAVMPFAVPDTSANILANIEHFKRTRSEMGGAALDLQSAQLQIGGDRMGSQGLDRAYSVAEQLSAMMTKIIAQSLIRSVYLLAHATIRENFNEPVPIKRNGKWFEPVPAKWQERECCTVKVGMSPGERARLMNALWQMLQAQIQLWEKGGQDVIVNLEGFYALLMDWARVADVQNPEQYFVDPASDGAQRTLQLQRDTQAKMQQQQQALMQQAVGLEQLRAALEKYQGDADRQFKYYDAVLKAETEEAKIVGKATAELLKAKAAGKAKADGQETDTGSEGAEEQQAA